MFQTSPFESPVRVRPREASLALYEATVIDGELQTMSPTTNEAFNVFDYSRFKYGCYPQTERYGSLLADALHHYLSVGLQVQADEPIVITGTPYKSMPNAAKLLAGVVERKLRGAGYATSLTRFYQHSLAGGDYGKLPVRERDFRNAQKVRFLDGNDFADAHVVIVDDVRITGSIERSIKQLLEEIPLRSLTTINLVRLDAQVALANPAIEDALNHAHVQSLADLLPLMASPDQFVLITRTVKRILEAEQSELEAFLSELDNARRIELYNATVDEGYSQMDRYAQSFRILTHFYPY